MNAHLASPVRSRARPVKTTLGRVSPPLFVIGAFTVGFTLFTLWQQSSSGPMQVSHVVANALGMGLVAGFAFLLATPRVEVVDGRLLRVVNIFFAISVDTDQVVALTHDLGLKVRLLNGESFGSSAFGQSVLGGILGYRRAAHVVAKWERLSRDNPQMGRPVPMPVRRTRRMRAACVPYGLLWPLAYASIGAVIFELKH